MEKRTEDAPPLLVSWMAERSGVASLADRLGYARHAAYLYFGLLVVLNYGVIAMVQYITKGYHPVTAYPLWLVPTAAGLFGLLLVRYLVRVYETSREDLKEVVVDEDELPSGIAPVSLQILVYAVLIVSMVVWLLQPGVLETIRSVQGPLGLPRHVLIYSLLRIPIVAEASAVILGTVVLLPWRLVRAELDVDFGDPYGFGGLKPVAKLLQRAMILYFIGLFAFTLYALAPRLFPAQPGVRGAPFVSAGIVGTWLLGFGLFAGSIWRIHVRIKRQKETRIAELREQLSQCDSLAEPFPDLHDVYDVSADVVLLYLYLETVLERVESTREYPTNTPLVRELFISSLPTIGVYIVTIALSVLGS